MDYNKFFSEGGSYAIDQTIKGQTALQMYDPLSQMVFRPEIRGTISGEAAIVLPYQDSGLWGLWSQIQALFGTEKKMVKASEFYWAEYDLFETASFSVLQAAGGVPAGGVAVTVNINRFSMSQNGLFSKPIAGFQAYLKYNQQKVNILAVNESASGTIAVTLQPINGQVLDLTKKSQYTIVQAPMKPYSLNSTGPIQTHGEVGNPPILYKSWVQKYEDGLAVDESEIDNFVYNKTFFIKKGLDPFGNSIDYWYAPQLSQKAEGKLIMNRNMKALFDVRDKVNNEGFNGMIPTINTYGMFNFSYDNFMSGRSRACSLR